MSYQVDFTTVESFLADLSQEDVSVVRCDTEKMDVNDGVSNVFIKAGFLVEDELRQLTMFCGEAIKGQANSEGIEYSLAVTKEIAEYCLENNIDLRAGVYN